MTTAEIDEYCSFTKAVEHLGDRWSLLILRELVMAGPKRFNDLAGGLPGHISRSVLSERLRRLEDVGLVARRTGRRGSQAPYTLTDAGEAFIPTLQALRGWADAWLPDDPAMAERDPDIVFAWLIERVDRAAVPERSAVVELTMRADRERQCWVVVDRGSPPYGCFEDPLLDPDRYVYLSSSAAILFAIARGRRAMADAVADGTVTIDGDPFLARQAPSWFTGPGVAERPPSDSPLVAAG
jgi:DNA-binding HxlR family transcriptional regulator